MVGKTISHYRVIEKIGQGGMGEVYLAHDLSLDRKVAVKFLPETLERDETARKRFVREARSAAALDHPYICSIHEVGEAEGRSFIVMEYLEGQTLRDRLTQGAVPLRQAMQWAVEIAEALAEAHEKGIIHRDLKPANTMLLRTGHAKVMDFGLAKQVSVLPESGDQESTLTAGLTREGTTVGTLPYMSPEQVHGRTIDLRSDLFSFGIVLYEMLTGVNPFKRDSGFDTAEAILREDPGPVSKHRSEVPQLLVALINKLLAKDPKDRYQRAREVADNLQNALDEAFGERPASDSGHVVNFKLLWQQAIRPRVFIPGLLILLALCGLAGWSIFRITKVRWAREHALPEIVRLLEIRNYSAAYNLASQAERYIGADPQLAKLWPEISARSSVHTTPPGADVSMKEYPAVGGEWQYLGRSPLDGARIPIGYFRWRIAKPGYMPVEVASNADNSGLRVHDIRPLCAA